jgi:hypothetical protein
MLVIMDPRINTRFFLLVKGPDCLFRRKKFPQQEALYRRYSIPPRPRKKFCLSAANTTQRERERELQVEWKYLLIQ